MEVSSSKIQEYGKRLMLSRLRLLNTHGFYGLLLMHMRFAIDVDCETASTDGTSIYFGAQFLESLSDSELDFIMMHEILHVALQHITRGKDLEHERFNIACDIVINSNILLANNMQKTSIMIGGDELMHIAPDGKEGHIYTAEAVYAMLPSTPSKKKSKTNNGFETGRAKQVEGNAQGGIPSSGIYVVDDHSRWGSIEEDDLLRDVWVKRVNDAATSMEIREKSQGRGLIPVGVRRLLKDIRTPQTNWRAVLNEFVQEEITDYSFSPPDRRFDDSGFFLPDFNEKEELVQDVLFMIDTSGSMSDGMVTAVYSEVKGAIDQHNGHLCGWLGFFDAAIIEPQEFTDESEFRIIKPAGAGGTDFQIIFEYVAQHMQDKPPSVIIIMTDGYAPFPQEHLSMGIPVLWLLVNDNVTPPWGKTTRVSV